MFKLVCYFFSFPLATTSDSLILFVQNDVTLNSRDSVSPGEQEARQKKLWAALSLPSLPSVTFILIPHMVG